MSFREKAAKVKPTPASLGSSKPTSGETVKDTQIKKLRDELHEIRKWKTKFLKKERERLRKTRRIIEKRKLRRDYILREIAAGRMTQKDMYLIYSKARLPIDTLGPKLEDGEADDDEDVAFNNQTEVREEKCPRKRTTFPSSFFILLY